MNVGPIGTLSSSDWWQNFEVNVHGVYNMSHGLIKATGGQGAIINLVSLATIKLGEFLDLENPKLRVFSVHPGMVEADNGRGMVIEALLPFSKDKAGLTGALAVYLTTNKADFLRGGYIHANWDVEELEAHKDEIAEKKLVKLGFINGEMQPGGYPWST
ncbi:putative short chain dehydrogenase reductase [Diaporthe ampelina]|uniref:Putative short chain dehydrogenase reductase n=1 Tax=Diaporthe ampelina TaxID=1214573 RepID=A0A0G2FXM4_9PEZI|nr:putative short chain dehydrogenase reductase [Diaporthe ampelina]